MNRFWPLALMLFVSVQSCLARSDLGRMWDRNRPFIKRTVGPFAGPFEAIGEVLSPQRAGSIVREAAKKGAAAAPEPTPLPSNATEPAKLAFMEATYLRRAVEVVSTFETGGTEDAFLDVTLDFDRAGLTLGSFGWTIGTGDLQPLIKKLRKAVVEKHMPKFGKAFWAACNSSIPEGLEIVRGWQIIGTDAKGRRTAKWHANFREVEGELKALLACPEMEKVQTDAIVEKSKPAITAAIKWAKDVRGATATPSLREYSVFLDTFVQNTGTKNKWTKDVNALFNGPATHDPMKSACDWLASAAPGDLQYDQAKQNAEIWKKEFPEKYSKLFLLSWLIAQNSRAVEARRLVLSPRGTLLANSGYVNRTRWNFKQLEEKVESGGKEFKDKPKKGAAAPKVTGTNRGAASAAGAVT